jgi:hypothetical protein
MQFFLYFINPTGIGYNLARVIMASADFSTHIYSYNDLCPDSLLQCDDLCLQAVRMGFTDFDLTLFKLANEDFTLKVGGHSRSSILILLFINMIFLNFYPHILIVF